MSLERIWLSSPHLSEEGFERLFVEEAFASNWVAPIGSQIDNFENEISSLISDRYAVALSSATAALHLAVKLCGVQRGDIVLGSSFTFSASADPVVYEGGTPVFIDSEPASWNMSPLALARALKSFSAYGIKPKAVIVVNLYGQSADMDALLEICNEYGVPLIEDAAESVGATYKGRMNGSFGKLSVISFNGNKIITSSGGGMLLSEDSAAIEKARFWATQARDQAPWYQHSEIGYNYRMSNIVAGIGRGQLRVLDRRVAQRRAVYERYEQALSQISGLSFMPEANYGLSNRWLTCITLEASLPNFMTVLRHLEEYNIETRPLWKPMHMQPVFAHCKYYEHEAGHDVSADLFSRGLCLPSGSNMTVEQQNKVIAALEEVLIG